MFGLALDFASQALSMISGWDRTRHRVRSRRSALRRHRCDPWRHQALLSVSSLACRVVQPTPCGLLVAPAGLAHGPASRLVRAAPGAIDLAAVAAAADPHLNATSSAVEQPGRRFCRRKLARAWTASASFATRAAHTCTTRCEGTAPSSTCQLDRRRAAISGSCHCAICADARCMRTAYQYQSALMIND